MNRMKRMEDLVVYFFVCICRDGSRLQFLSSCLLLPFFEIISALKSKQLCFFSNVSFTSLFLSLDRLSFLTPLLSGFVSDIWICFWFYLKTSRKRSCSPSFSWDARNETPVLAKFTDFSQNNAFCSDKIRLSRCLSHPNFPELSIILLCKRTRVSVVSRKGLTFRPLNVRHVSFPLDSCPPLSCLWLCLRVRNKLSGCLLLSSFFSCLVHVLL